MSISRRTVRNPKARGGAEFVPELIHNRSGAGSDVTAVDLNNDGKMDVIMPTDRGTSIFWDTGKPAKQADFLVRSFKTSQR